MPDLAQPGATLTLPASLPETSDFGIGFDPAKTASRASFRA